LEQHPVWTKTPAKAAAVKELAKRSLPGGLQDKQLVLASYLNADNLVASLK